MRVDAVVLGAGIVGTSVALHLAKRGVSVALVDRKAPGEETSYGNTGIMESSVTLPTPFPRDLATLFKAATKQLPASNFHWNAILSLAPWMFRYWYLSEASRNEASGRKLRPLFERCNDAHRALIAEIGAPAQALWAEGGFTALYRKRASFDATARARALADAAGIPYSIWSEDESLAAEPHLAPVFQHAIRWSGVSTVSNPGALVKLYAGLAERYGVSILTGNALTLTRRDGGFAVETAAGEVTAREAVVALGPWSDDVVARFGLRYPLAWKRGYHQHFTVRGNAALTRPILDYDRYYCIAPMQQGHRVTTGAEFTFRDAPKTPVQLGMVLPSAREMLPSLDQPVEHEPWMGRRPAFPDSLPILGRAPGVPGLVLAYGHTHWGYTLGPISGDLIADLMTGRPPTVDLSAFAAERFAV